MAYLAIWIKTGQQRSIFGRNILSSKIWPNLTLPWFIPRRGIGWGGGNFWSQMISDWRACTVMEKIATKTVKWVCWTIDLKFGAKSKDDLMVCEYIVLKLDLLVRPRTSKNELHSLSKVSIVCMKYNYHELIFSVKTTYHPSQNNIWDCKAARCKGFNGRKQVYIYWEKTG